MQPSIAGVALNPLSCVTAVIIIVAHTAAVRTANAVYPLATAQPLLALHVVLVIAACCEP